MLINISFIYGQKDYSCDAKKCFTQESKPEYSTVKRNTKKEAPCTVVVWDSGTSNNKKFHTYYSSYDIAQVTFKDKSIVEYRILDDIYGNIAVYISNWWVFVDKDYSQYLLDSDHNCHGLPDRPTQYIKCRFCDETYKKQSYYNSNTRKSMNIYVDARKCSKNENGTGNHDNLDLGPVPPCPKNDCDSKDDGGIRNN